MPARYTLASRCAIRGPCDGGCRSRNIDTNEELVCNIRGKTRHCFFLSRRVWSEMVPAGSYLRSWYVVTATWYGSDFCRAESGRDYSKLRDQRRKRGNNLTATLEHCLYYM